jgi:hypothetical protein
MPTSSQCTHAAQDVTRRHHLLGTQVHPTASTSDGIIFRHQRLSSVGTYYYSELLFCVEQLCLVMLLVALPGCSAVYVL